MSIERGRFTETSPLIGRGTQEISSTISDSLTSLLRLLATLNKKQNLLGTLHDTRKLRSELHQLRKEARAAVKDVALQLRRRTPSHIPQQRAKLLKLQEQFADVRQQVEKVCEASLRKERSFPVQDKDPSPVVQHRNVEEFLERPTQPPPPTQSQQEQLHMQDEKEFAKSIIEEQNKDFVEITQEFEALQECFEDFRELLGEQGELIVVAETNVHQADVAVEEAVKDLEKADSYAWSARKKTFCLWTILLGVLAAIVLGVSLYFVLR